MTIPILTPIHRWHCPECGKQDVTHEMPPPGSQLSRMHTCPKLRYLMAPMLPEGVSGKLEVHDREDYVGTESVRLDPERGRPVMNITTTRDNGQDCMVFVPTVTANLRS